MMKGSIPPTCHRHRADGQQEEFRPAEKINTADIDGPLHAIGFEYDVVSSVLVSGRLTITKLCCQPFGYLHGGISALIAEALASNGAHITSGYGRVAGVQLCINHVKAAQVGDTIVAEATPVATGKTLQVWNVELRKADPSTSEKGAVVASSRVTVFCNLPTPDGAASSKIMKYARL